MAENDEWQIYRWYCVNCGHIVQGFKNKDGNIKVVCEHCNVVMVRMPRSRRVDDFHVTAPKGGVYI